MCVQRLIVFMLILFATNTQTLANTSVVADASLWLRNKFSNNTCQDLNQQDYQQIQNYLKQQGCTLSSNATSAWAKNSVDGVINSTSLLLSKDMNSITETQFFHSLAKKNFDQLDCKLSSIDQFAKSPQLIEMRAQEIFDKLAFISEQRRLANQANHDYQNMIRENNSLANSCSNSTGEFRKKCYADLEQSKANEKDLEKKWQTHRALALSFTASLWNGSTETMSAAIAKLASKTPLPSKDEITTELKKQIPYVRAEIFENKNNLIKQSGLQNNLRYFDHLTDATKRQLLETSLDSGLFTKAYKNKDPSIIKLLCRLEGQYTKGRDKLNEIATGSTFVLGGFAGLLSKIPIAVRAGQLGNVITKARDSSAIVGALATGMDAANMAESIHASCFSNTLNLSISNSCPKNANDFQQAEIQKFEQDNCILNAAMTIAPAGLLATSTAYKSLSTVIDKYKEAYGLAETKSISGIMKADAIQTQKKIASALFTKPVISAEVFAKNQREAEAYFKSNNLKVSPGKVKSTHKLIPSSVDISAVEYGLKNFSPYETQVLESTKNLRTVFVLDEAPKASRMANADSPFWQHPEFKNRFEESKKMGVTIVLDPQKKGGAFYNPQSQSIYLNPNAPFHLLEHEFAHAQFDAYISSKVSSNRFTIDPKFREGTKLSMILPDDDIKKIGSKNISYMQGLLEKYNSSLTINESFAVRKELNAIGWRPINPEYYFAKTYGGWYRVTELLEAKKAAGSTSSIAVMGAAGPIHSAEFTAQQAKMLDQELIQMSLYSTLNRASHITQKQITEVRTNIANGNIPMALATWRKMQGQFQQQELDNNTTYFYNENGGFIRMNRKDSRIEYTNMNSEYPTKNP